MVVLDIIHDAALKFGQSVQQYNTECLAQIVTEWPMVTFGITGTCGNCKSRFRFDVVEVAKLDRVYCPACGHDFGEEGKDRIIVYAQGILRELAKIDSSKYPE